MSKYREELLQLVQELNDKARAVNFAIDPNPSETFEKYRRQAEVLGFIIDHPEFLKSDNGQTT